MSPFLFLPPVKYLKIERTRTNDQPDLPDQPHSLVFEPSGMVPPKSIGRVTAVDCGDPFQSSLASLNASFRISFPCLIPLQLDRCLFASSNVQLLFGWQLRVATLDSTHQQKRDTNTQTNTTEIVTVDRPKSRTRSEMKEPAGYLLTFYSVFIQLVLKFGTEYAHDCLPSH